MGTMQDLSDIMFKLHRAEAFTKGWHRNIKRWRRRYNLQHYDSKALPNENRYTDPVLTNVVDLAVGIMQSNDWIWKSSAFNATTSDTADKSMIEKAVAAFIDINTDRNEYDLKYETNLNFIRDGGACLLGVWDKFVNDNFQRKGTIVDREMNVMEDANIFYELPLRVEVIDPLQINLLPGGYKRWLCQVRKEEMSVYDAEETYQVELDAFKGKSRSDKIDTKGQFRDFWELAYELIPEGATDYEGLDSEEDIEKYDMKKHLVVRNAILFDGEFLRPLRIMDGYSDLPYTVSFYNPALRTDSSSWHSILSPLEDPVKELEETTNMRKRLMHMYAGMPLVAQTRGKTITVDKSMGKVVNLREGENLGFPVWKGTAPDVEKHLKFAQGRIQQSGFSDVMYGEGGGDSGYGLSMLTDQNRIRLTPPITHLENMWTWAVRKWVKLVDSFAPASYLELYGSVRGEEFSETVLGGDLIKYNIRCKIKPEFPNERVRKHAMATQVAGILPAEVIIEDYLGYQQPDEVRTKKLQETIENNPATVQYTIMKELAKRAKEGDEVAAQSLEMMKQQMMGQQAQGRPPEPNNPEQPTGLQSPTGLPPEETVSAESVINRAMTDQANAAPKMDGTV